MARGLLSITSRVANGRVGNTLVANAVARVAPGLPLHTIDTVQWSAPGDHPRRIGPVLAPESLRDLLGALLAPGQNSFSISHLLTGYLRTTEQIAEVADAIQRHLIPREAVIVDPVSGDGGRLYIDAATAQALRDMLVPLAGYILPNTTEAAFLTGLSPETPANELASAALRRFPNLKGVAITSAVKEQGTIGVFATDGASSLWQGGAVVEGRFHGTGDYYAGCVAGLVAVGDVPFLEACRLAQSLTFDALDEMRDSPPDR